jgi:hypothetical protein
MLAQTTPCRRCCLFQRTFAPLLASSKAKITPMPRDEPVTMATLSFNVAGCGVFAEAMTDKTIKEAFQIGRAL